VFDEGRASVAKESEMQRSRFEIMAGIMQECLVPRRKTRIMYKNNLSYTQANAYLSLLISQELLLRQDGQYETTDKGHQFLSAFDQLESILSKPVSSVIGTRAYSTISKIHNF
jgi:predicted transcriptional regulator